MQPVLLAMKKRIIHFGLSFSCAALLMATLILTMTAFSKPSDPDLHDPQSNRSRPIHDSVRQYLSRDEDDEEAIQQLFVLGDNEVPSLVNALEGTSKEARIRAAKGIAYIGTTPGIEALRGAVEKERDKPTRSVLAFFLAGRLIDSKSKADFDFLVSSVNRAHAVKERDDDTEAFPAVSAVLALSLIGNSDCLPILRKAARLDLVDSDEVSKAVRWLEKESVSRDEKRPSPDNSVVSNEEEQIKTVVLNRTFFAEGNDTSIDHLTLNASKNEALVSLIVASGPKNRRGYDLVLSKASGEWRVVGVWFGWIS